MAQQYTYVSPKNAKEFVDILSNAKADVVVLDAHGGYSNTKDQLYIEIAGAPIPIDDLLPDAQVPPVWVLSACHTAVTGAMRGCFVRALLAKGAICVVASLSRVDAFTASMFVGRLGLVLSDFFAWTHRRELDIRKYRHEIAYFVGESILRHGLQQTQIGHLKSGIVRPETLFFSVFGVPAHVELKR